MSYTLYDILSMLVYKSLTQTERMTADEFAGPDQTFPLWKNGMHIRSAWDLAGHADNPDAIRAKILRFAKAHDLMKFLPGDAQHWHPAVIKKAFSSLTVKAVNENGVLIVEGWVSTPDVDLQHDIVEPEAFVNALDGYAARGMPLSSEHNLQNYPVGHGQRVVVVRDGQVLKSAVHPVDPADDFEFFPQAGTGVYGRYAINDQHALTAVSKGNVRGFSFVGNPDEYEPLPNGGKRYKSINPWMETTIAAYPVNEKAVVLAAQ